MSEPTTVEPKPKAPTRNDQKDGQVLAHVEKWMAMIREIAREKTTSQS
jgi:hypothetical protein